MTMKLRPVQFHIQPVVVVDDGTTLTPVEVSPIVVSAANIETFHATFSAELVEKEAELNRLGDAP